MRRGRKSPKDALIYINLTKYQEDLEKAIQKVMERLHTELLELVKAKAAAMDFKTIKARLVDGRETSDMERREAFLNSIVPHITGSIKSGVLTMAVAAMEDNFKDSHIGFYYEYGTGEEELPFSPIFNWGDWNPFRGVPRAGAPIVTRGYKEVVKNQYGEAIRVNGRVLTRGSQHAHSVVWKDLGGNYRETNSVVGGIPLKKEMYETHAYRWMYNSYMEIKDKYFDEIQKAVYSVNPLSDKYFSYRKEIKIVVGGGT
jgi:hypothetical protein